MKYFYTYNIILNPIIKLAVIVLFVLTNNQLLAQNVGIGTTSPTNSFHIVRAPGNPNPDPLRVENLRNTNSDTAFLVIDNSGVVKYIYLNDLKGKIIGDLDSLIIVTLINNSDTLLGSQKFSDSLRSFIYRNADTLFLNQPWLDSLTTLLKDSIDTDVDSLVISPLDSLYLYENGKRISVYLPDLDIKNELIDSIFLRGDSIVIIENNISHYLNIKVIIDSFETVTTLINTDSTISYTNENGVTTAINVKKMIDSSETITSITFTDSTITYFDERGVGTLINLATMLDSIETLTVFNKLNDSILFYIDENGDTSKINVSNLAVSIAETLTYFGQLGDSIYYVNENGDTTKVFVNKDTVITTLIDNGNGTFSYTSEDGSVTNFDAKDTNTTKFGQVGDSVYYVNGFGDTTKVFVNNDTVITTLIDNGNGTFSYTSEDGSVTNFDAKDTNTTKFGQVGDSVYYVDGFGDTTKVLVNNNTVISTLIDDGNGLFTYTDETGLTTTFDAKDTVLTYFGQLGDSIYYVNGFGDTTKVFVNNDTVITTLIDNGNGTFSYTSEDGSVTNFDAKDTNTTKFGQVGDSVYYVNGFGDTTKVFVNNDTVITTLIDNGNGTFSYTSEDGSVTNFDAKDTNTTKFGQVGDSVYYVNGFGDTTKVFVNNDTVITTLIDNGNGTFSYTSEDGSVTNFDAKDTNTTKFGQVGDSIYYVNGFGDTTKVFVNNDTVITTLIDNGNGTFSYTSEDGSVTNFDAKDTNTTKFGQVGDSVYYVNGFGDTTKVFVNNNTVISTLIDDGNGLFTYTDETGLTTTFDAKDTVLTYFGQLGDSIYYVDENSDSIKIYLEDLDSTNEWLDSVVRRGDTLYYYENSNVQYVVLPTGSVVTDDQNLTLSNDTLYIQDGNFVVLEKDTVLTYFGQLGDSIYYVNENGDTTKVFVNNDTVITTLIDNGNGTFSYTSEDGSVTNFDAKDTNTTKFGQLGDSIYYVNGFGDTTKVFVNKDTVITTLIDNGNGTFSYTSEDGSVTNFDAKDTNTTKFGQVGDSVYYVNGFGDTTKVFVNNDTVITTLIDNGNGTFSYTSEDGSVTNFDAKDTNTTKFGQVGDSVYYVNGFGDTTKVFVIGTIDSISHLRIDTLSVYQGNFVSKVALANTMAEIYDVAGGDILLDVFAVLPFGNIGIVDANYTTSANSITVTKTGRYRVTYRITVEMTDGNNRSESEYQLTNNNVVIPGTYAAASHRNRNINVATTIVVKVLDLNAGETIRVEGRRAVGSGYLKTKANGSSLLIENL